VENIKKLCLGVEGNPYFPLPVEYPKLTPEVQREERVKAVSSFKTPDEFVVAWSFFRSYYLSTTEQGFFYKTLVDSPQFHYQMVKDLWQFSYNVTAAPRGAAKCLRGDQRVLTSKGYVPLSQVKRGMQVLSFSEETRKGEWRDVEGVVCSGRKPLWEVTTCSGHKIVASKDHRFKTEKGWMRAEDLREGVTFLTVPSDVPSLEVDGSLLEEEAEVIGILLGDGTIRSDIRVTTADEEIVSLLSEFGLSRGWELLEKGRYHYQMRVVSKGKVWGERQKALRRKGLPREYAYTTAHWLREKGLFGMTCSTKRIPKVVWEGGDRAVRACLRGLFDTDGTASKRGTISFCSSNYELARDVQLLLLQVGFQSRLRKGRTSCNGKTFTSWKVNIRGLKAVWRFSQEVGFRIKRKQRRLSKPVGYLAPDTYDIIPFDEEDRRHLSITPYFLRKKGLVRVDNKYNLTREKGVRVAEITGQGWLRERALSSLHWDKVIKKEKVEEGETWDIQVAGGHNFLCEGVFVHNSIVIGTEIPLMLSVVRPYFHTSICMATDSLVNERIDHIMEQISGNERLTDDFGRLKPHRGEGIWSHHYLRLTNGARIQGFSVTGRKRGGRPDLFILDDPEFDSTSQESASRLVDQFQRLMFRVVMPMLEAHSRMYWVGTMIDLRSFMYHAFYSGDDRFDGWNRRIFAAGVRHPLDKFNQLLWDQKMGVDFLVKREKDIGGAAFNAEYLNIPSADDDRIFNIDDTYGYYSWNLAEIPRDPWITTQTTKVTYRLADPDTGTPVKHQDEPLRWLNEMYRITLVDYAYTVTKTSDFSCVMTVGFDRQDVLWVLDMWLGKVYDDELMKIILEQGRKWRVKTIGIEAVTIQRALVDSTRQEYKLRQANGGDDSWNPVFLPILYPANAPKPNRISGTQWRYSRHRIKFPRMPGCTDKGMWKQLFNQISDFTPSLTLLPHDDAIDTLAMYQYVPRGDAMSKDAVPKAKTPAELIATGEFIDEQSGVPHILGFGSQDISPEMLDKVNEIRHSRADRRKRPARRKLRGFKSKTLKDLGKGRNWT